MKDGCWNCKYKPTGYQCGNCVNTDKGFSKWKHDGTSPIGNKGIIFPILNGLTPTTESCTMKVLEEVGELMQLIGKGQGKSGEELDLTCSKRAWAIDTIKETIDTAQAAITMTVQLCKEYDIDIEAMMIIHDMKLREKEYLK